MPTRSDDKAEGKNDGMAVERRSQFERASFWRTGVDWISDCFVNARPRRKGRAVNGKWGQTVTQMTQRTVSEMGEGDSLSVKPELSWL
jgi:hypothetical protein